MRHSLVLAAILSVGGHLASITVASAAQVITTIATTSAQGGLGMTIPSINNNGQVAFIDTSPGTNGIYVGAGGPLTTVATSGTLFNQYGAGGGTTLSPDAGPVINDLGEIAFWANTTGSISAPGILKAQVGSLTTIVTGAAPVGAMGGSAYSGAPQISNSGTVAFTANRFGGFPGAGVFTGDGGPLTPIIQTNTETRYPIDPAISNNGTVAYEWTTLGPTGAPVADNLYLLHNGITTPIGSTNFGFFTFLAVNDLGYVAASSGSQIQMGNGGSFSTVLAASSEFSHFRTLSLNNLNDLVFDALRPTGEHGIYRGPDPVADKVIATGDTLLGATVMQLAFGRRGFNDHGDVAFWARLDNGQQGIFVASVPEPTSISLMLSGAVLVFAAHRRRFFSAGRRTAE
ncbi:MAG: choice-of-anchor tandem repeat NxxGxxAF-containing protein [Pirellulales bacterium]